MKARMWAARWAPISKASAKRYQRYAKKSWWKARRGYYCFCKKERLEEMRAAADAGEVAKYDKHCLHLPKEEVEARIAAGEELP